MSGTTGASYAYDDTLQVVMTDAQGTRMATTNLSGSVQTLLKTDVWGREISSSAARDDLAHFTGLANSPALGLIGPAARFYEPASFAFQSPDPLWFGPQIATHLQDDPFGMHPYRYALATPGVFTDRNGAAAETPWDVAVVAVDAVIIVWDGQVTEDEAVMFGVDVTCAMIPGAPSGVGLVGLGARAMFVVNKLPAPAKNGVLTAAAYAYRAMSKGSTMESVAEEFIRGMKAYDDAAKGARPSAVPQATHVVESGAPQLADGVGAGAKNTADTSGASRTFVTDPKSNTLIVPEGGRVTGSPDGSYVQTRRADGTISQRRDAAHTDPPKGEAGSAQKGTAPHGHGMDADGNSLDVYGNVVDRTSPEAHWDAR